MKQWSTAADCRIDSTQSIWHAAIKNGVAVIEQMCQPAYKWKGRGRATNSDKT